MMLTILIFFFVYGMSLTIIIQVGLLRQFKKERSYKEDSERINPNELSVLIPFRNEEKRLSGLIDSINNSKRAPKKYYFINDHSDDNSIEVLKNSLNVENYAIIDLPEGVTGKKKALRFAAQSVDTKYTLTLDADVEFADDYFGQLALVGEVDMYVLPVIMKSKKWYEHFFEIDLILVTAANAGLAGLKRPIMASGANLLYKTSTFNKVDNVESHIHMASGDDTYLLRDFRESHSNIRLHTDPKLAITTETPQSFKEFIGQRLRWIGKTGDIKDNLSTSLAIIQAVLTVGFLVLLTWMAVLEQWQTFFVLFGVKSFLDFVIFALYFVRIGRGVALLFIPIYEVLFPLYTVLLVILLFTYKPKWKGRTIYEK